MTRASAPGKLILFGEYAVLDGAPAVVVAVDRRARVVVGAANSDQGRLRAPEIHDDPMVWRPGDGSRRWDVPSAVGEKLGLVDALLDELATDCPADITIDTAAFMDGAHKLGLGASAAITVAWLAAATGSADAETIGRRALAVHRRFQGGRGSGADIAASAWGGLIEYRINGGEGSVQHRGWPKAAHWAAVWTGRSADTRAFLQRLEDWRASQPRLAARRLTELADLSEQSASAVREGQGGRMVVLADEWSRALLALGVDAGMSIVTDEHRRLVELARDHGLAYKPSGAGGGDLGVIFSTTADGLAEFGRAAASLGAEMLPLAISEQGVRLEADSQSQGL